MGGASKSKADKISGDLKLQLQKQLAKEAAQLPRRVAAEARKVEDGLMLSSLLAAGDDEPLASLLPGAAGQGRGIKRAAETAANDRMSSSSDSSSSASSSDDEEVDETANDDVAANGSQAFAKRLRGLDDKQPNDVQDLDG